MLPGIPLKEPDGILPDSRAGAARGAIPGPGGYWVPIYCANCGRTGGNVPEETTTIAFWLCDNCYQQHGEVAGTLAIPDEVVFQELAERRRAEQQQSEGA